MVPVTAKTTLYLFELKLLFMLAGGTRGSVAFDIPTYNSSRYIIKHLSLENFLSSRWW